MNSLLLATTGLIAAISDKCRFLHPSHLSQSCNKYLTWCSLCTHFCWFQKPDRRYMAEILPIRRKTLSNPSISRPIVTLIYYAWSSLNISMSNQFNNWASVKKNVQSFVIFPFGWYTSISYFLKDPWHLLLLYSSLCCIVVPGLCKKLISVLFSNSSVEGNRIASLYLPRSMKVWQDNSVSSDWLPVKIETFIGRFFSVEENSWELICLVEILGVFLFLSLNLL